ncbi:DNA polymerase III subunit alpha [Staphylospora marina]|uniref:DNA polymerase III subunit alpha n=1 Tax=Staphylospora marina TaxID=2490858 RepID=UPI000F5BBEB2|nr:DNA polymerase III subunit alpha [Staphylospora marina]
MHPADFVHLHVHTEYSLLDGAARIGDLVARAARMGMRALAVTDHGAMHGVVPFYKECLRHGIRPVIGCEVYLAEGDRREKPPLRESRIYHLLLLAATDEGYRNLMKLTSEAHLTGFHYKPRIDKELLRRYSRGLVATSSCLAGEIPQAILAGRMDDARRLVGEYVEIFGKDSFFFELQDHGLPEQMRVNRQLIEWSREFDIPLIATNDVHYVDREDHGIHDCLLCIGTGRKLDDPDRMRFHGDGYYLKSTGEMERVFAHVPDALRNTVELAERCRVEIPLGGRLLPRFPLPEGTNARDFLRELCRRGAEKRYGKPVPEEIFKRLEYELSVIDRMDFNDYFLVVWDFVRFARKQGIAVGPGRGSAAGSLVSYVLGITDVDPIRYGLLFERFLNPERVSMPDIDIDFNYERRDEVIRYVSEKYGPDRVAQIVTFGTMAPRAAVRDVGRVMGIPYGEVDRVAKLIPGSPGMTLEKAFRAEPRLRELSDKPGLDKLFEAVEKVEGMPRHASTHAAGVVISGVPLTDHVPLMEGSGGIPLTQYPMEVLEEIGLLKADFLGLRNLTVIERAVRLIREHRGIHIDISKIDHDDPETFALLSAGDTTGVFQMESAGMRRVLRELKPSCFEDVIAVLALYRPGPMEQIPRFVRAKHGQERVTYPHPDLEDILKNTYGIIVYQEQIMRIASKMAGFSLGEADLLRRAVSKKDKQLLDRQRTAFVEGCLRSGYDEETGNRIYDLIVRFADYGFNRSHSAAYAVLAWQTAWLKAHWPLEFMAALLSTVVGNQGKMAEYAEEARRMGIRVLPPDINRSGFSFTVEEGAIRFGLNAVKNVGTQAVRAILKAREEDGPFTHLMDVCRRVDHRICNRRVLEALILCGAMDPLPGERNRLLSILDEVLELTAGGGGRKAQEQISLFAGEDDDELFFGLLEESTVTPLGETERMEAERDHLGMYLTGHPLDRYDSKISRWATHRIIDLHGASDRERTVVAGLIVSVKRIRTRQSEPMAFLTLEDRTGQAEVVVFPKTLSSAVHLVDTGKPVLVRGTVQTGDEGAKIIADRLEDLARLPEHSPDAAKEKAVIRISADREEPGRLAKLKNLLSDSGGELPVWLYYERTGKVLALPPERYGAREDDAFRMKVERLMGTGSFRLKR